MKTENTSCVETLCKELELRNYSPRSIKTYCETVACLKQRLGKPASAISQDEFKGYVYRYYVQTNLSPSAINQTISAFKIL